MNAEVNGITPAMQRALDTPLDQIDVSHPDLFFDNSVMRQYFLAVRLTLRLECSGNA